LARCGKGHLGFGTTEEKRAGLRAAEETEAVGLEARRLFKEERK
jgi:hypothetical protein